MKEEQSGFTPALLLNEAILIPFLQKFRWNSSQKRCPPETWMLQNRLMISGLLYGLVLA